MSFLSNLFGGHPVASDPPQVNGQKARALVAGGATLLDVRTPPEFRGGHPDAAVNIPVDQLPRRVDELDTARPVVVYCRSGNRSARAVKILQASGFKTVYDLKRVTDW
jgi:phage shock protein E